MNDREHLGKFDSKSDDSVFLCYSNNSRAYYVYNMRILIIIESVNVVVNDFNDFSDFSKKKEISSFTNEAWCCLRCCNKGTQCCNIGKNCCNP